MADLRRAGIAAGLRRAVIQLAVAHRSKAVLPAAEYSSDRRPAVRVVEVSRSCPPIIQANWSDPDLAPKFSRNVVRSSFAAITRDPVPWAKKSGASQGGLLSVVNGKALKKTAPCLIPRLSCAAVRSSPFVPRPSFPALHSPPFPKHRAPSTFLLLGPRACVSELLVYPIALHQQMF